MTSVIITPNPNRFSLYLKELWGCRDILYTLFLRDVKIRYRRTLLGVGWVVLQPLATMVVFSLFFGKLAKIPSGDLPYPLFVYSGLIIWNFFTSAVTNASNSIVSAGGIIEKVYFPRLILPLSGVATALLDFFVNLVFLGLMLAYYRITPNPMFIVFFPVILLNLLLLTGGLGFFLASLKVKYNDIGLALPYVMQVGIFLTPVIYPLGIVYDYKKWLLLLNPLTAILEVIRTLIGGGLEINFPLFLLSGVISMSFFLFGLFYFRKLEGVFADIV